MLYQPIRIAARASRLAQAQARPVAGALAVPAELVAISTRADRTARPLAEVGGKGLFTAELEEALRAGRVHLAVHSAKDVPAVMADGTVIAAVPPRADPRDALLSPGGAGLDALPRGARVGTSSPRRACQLLASRPDLLVVPVRGNVDTRLGKLRAGQVDALVLAMAGLERLGLLEELAGMIRPLPVELFVPAAGQGALVVQCLASAAEVRALASAANDAQAASALAAERMVVRRLGAGCRSAVGVHVRREGPAWRAMGMVGTADGKQLVRRCAVGPGALAAAERLLASLAQAGAGRIIASCG